MLRVVAALLAAVLSSPLPAFASASAGGGTVLASWYSSADACGEKTNKMKGCPTASGVSIYDLERTKKDFAASNSFPLGSRVRVCREGTGRCVSVEIFDRGGFQKYGRKIDLSKSAFKKLAPICRGLIKVTITREGV